MILGHGDDAFRFDRPIRANFSSNVYSHVDLSQLKEHLASHIDVIDNYPEPEPYRLEAALAKRHGIDVSSVCVTAGATEAIYLIALAFSGSRSAILQPTFSEYEDACTLHGHKILHSAQDDLIQDLAECRKATLCPTLPDLPFCPAKKGVRRGAGASPSVAPGITAKSVDTKERSHSSAGSDILWLCNPNNPDGRVIAKDKLIEAINNNPTTLFVTDQSYGFFTREPLLSPAEALRFPNVLQLHSMTKRYAMPGLRLGYVTGNPGLLDKLRAVRMPWSVNALAVEAGLYLAEHPDTAPIDLDGLLAEAQRLRERLNGIQKVSVDSTQTHFMLCRLETGRAADLKEWLVREKGLLIRDASNFKELDKGCFRIAAQTPEENDMLVEAIREWQQLQL